MDKITLDLNYLTFLAMLTSFNFGWGVLRWVAWTIWSDACLLDQITYVIFAFWKIKNLLKWLFPTSILKYGLKIFFKKLCLISFVAILLNNLWAILEVVKTLFRHGQIIYQHQKDKISKVKLAIMQQCA